MSTRARGRQLLLGSVVLVGLALTVWLVARMGWPRHEPAQPSAPAVSGAPLDGPGRVQDARPGPTLQGSAPTTRGIAGRVVDAKSGAGIAGARVRASRRGDDPILVDVESDTDGSFEIDVANARGATLWAWHAAYGVPEVIELRGAVNRAVLIRLTPVDTIAGRVVDERGEPMAGVRVRLEQENTYLAYAIWTHEDDEDTPPLPLETRADASGRFAIPARRPAWGPLFVAPLEPGWAARWTVVPLAGSEAAKRELVLTMVRGATLSGRVSMDRVGPLPGCLVSATPGVWYDYAVESELLPWAHDRLTCLTDARGRFEIDGVPPDAAQLKLWPHSSNVWHSPHEWLMSSLSSN